MFGRPDIAGPLNNQSEQNLPIRSLNGPFIVAECGVNWRDLVDADQMIKASAEAGADACKFQAYNLHFIKPFCGWKTSKLSDKISVHTRASELNAIRLDESTIRYLYWRCQHHGIEFMCTPMYPEAVAMLDPYVKRWKVRYADRMNHDILQKCIDTRKEILCSEQSPKFHDQIKSLYCCSEYPPAHPPIIENVLGMWGYSCHIPEFGHLSNICVNKMTYLEVHVRLDHYEPPHYCPIDTAVSITMSELAELCRRLKQ